MKRVLVHGAAGNMGRRYVSILNMLGVDVVEIDPKDPGMVAPDEPAAFEGDAVILATPTGNHCRDLFRIMNRVPVGTPILCEKPLTKNLGALALCLQDIERFQANVQMVNQYQYVAHMVPALGTLGGTSYDYFKSGGDGLGWDCINILGMAYDGQAELANVSPVWRCMINGRRLQIGHMDSAYVAMVEEWLKNPRPNLDYARRAHERAAAWHETPKS